MARVLIVDDDEDFAAAVAEMLRQGGHDIEVEPAVGRALAHMAERRPDLVILDVMFPQGSSDGFGLARTMRHERNDLAAIPILMLTAVGQKFPFGFGPPDIGDDSLPVDDFVEKPIEPQALRDKVAALLAAAATEEGSSPE